MGLKENPQRIQYIPLLYTHTVQRNYLVALSLAAIDTSNLPLASSFSPDPSLLSSDLESLLGIPDVCHDYDKSQYMEHFCICFYYGQAGDRLSVAFCVRYSQRHNFEEASVFIFPSYSRCSSSSPLEIEQNHYFVHSL